MLIVWVSFKIQLLKIDCLFSSENSKGGKAWIKTTIFLKLFRKLCNITNKTICQSIFKTNRRSYPTVR